MFLVVAENYLHRAKDFFASCAALPEGKLAVCGNLGGDTARTGDPGWPRRYSIPCDIPYSAIKAGVKKEEGGDVQSGGVCLPKKPLCVTRPAFLDELEYLPADGKKWMNRFALFVHTAFALLSNLSSSHPVNSHAFTFPIFTPSHLGRGSEWLCST